MRALACVLAGMFVVTAAESAQAGILMDGQTLRLQFWYPDITTLSGGSTDFVVGPSVEATLWGDSANLDVSDTNILLSLRDSVSIGWAQGDFNGFSLSDVYNTIPTFTSVTINPATNLSGFDSSRITFDSNNIWLNFAGLTASSNLVVSLDVNSAAVPEPSTLIIWSLLGSLGIAIGYWRRKWTA